MLNPRCIEEIVTGGLSRRAFVATTVGGAVGLALLQALARYAKPW